MKNWILVATIWLMLSGAVLAATDQPVNINTAEVAELAQLDGIGEAKAEAIVAYREENGPFTHIDELVKVSGIGLATLERNRTRVRVDEPPAAASTQ